MRLLLTVSGRRVHGVCGERTASAEAAPLPDRLWASAIDVLADLASAGPTSLAVATDTDDVVLLDVETLGSPAPVLTREIWRRLPDDAPHTWALVEDGRYAVLSLDGYLAARLTRGLWLVGLDPVGRGAPVERVAAGQPVGATDPTCAAGLALPLRLVLGDDVVTDTGAGSA